MQHRDEDIKFTAQRMRLVREIEQKGIQSRPVLNAIETVPRHLFFNKALIQYAYKDSAYLIEAGQTISQPYTVAFQTQLLNIMAGAVVLEVGTGSGYQAAVLAQMGATVVSIERQAELHTKASQTLKILGYKVKTFFGDGYLGNEILAPYDGIIITAAAPQIPKALLTQLKIGGRMIIPLGEGGSQIMTRITREDSNDYKSEQFGNFAFVPMLKGTN